MGPAPRPSNPDRFPGVLFYNPALIEVQDDVEIGRGTRVGTFTLIHQGARIGKECTIGSHCNVYGTIGDRASIQTGCHITQGTVIGDDVFLGPGVITLNDKHMTPGHELVAPRIREGARIGGGSVLLPGIVVGAKAVIGAGSVVTRNVEGGKVVYGNPAREK